uniref:Nucleoside-diphosphatase uda-1 n=1 Tax=Haemonchus contortus TaxID=6289 RepID=A0A7I4YRW4_HAECO
MIRCSFIFISFCISIIISTKSRLEEYYCYNSGILQSAPCRLFAIVFDAGSTGTRLHLYRFLHNTDRNGIPFKVEEEIFREVKPGLSSFSGNPTAAAASIRSLLDTAQKHVPIFMWDKTPITLKATAGLRLLPGDLADDILDAVENVIANSGFFVVPDAVGIMSGSDEGMYSWFTLNILLNKLYSDDAVHPYHPEPSRSVAAFDLGGGSTQLTFWPEDRHMFDFYPEYERDIDFFGYRMRLFTHSFLGNGLVAARLNVLVEDSGSDPSVVSQLDSPCMPASFEIREWEYGLKKWAIRGSPTYSFASCYTSVRNFIDQSGIMKLKALRGKVIYLFSYFYDRGLNAGLVKENHGGEVKLKDFKAAAQKACLRKAEELGGFHWMPWQCHDLTYIYSLLHDGYGFDDTQPLFLAKKLKGMEVAWGLGLSHSLVHEFHKTQKLSTAAERGNVTVVDQIMSFIYSGTNNVLSYLNIIS